MKFISARSIIIFLQMHMGSLDGSIGASQLRAYTTQSIEPSLVGKLKKSQQRALGEETISSLFFTNNKIWSHKYKTHDIFIKR
jgi:hypothetical protein